MKTKTLTFKVVKRFPEENMMIATYGRESYMLPYDPDVKVGEGVDVIVEELDK